MTQPPKIRPALIADLEALATIADQTLFPGEMLADMIAPFFADEPRATWAVAEIDATIVGFAFAEVEPMTDGTWNIKAIAVADAARRLGAGRALIRFVEQQSQARLIVIDTTQLDDQEAGRSLYQAAGYSQVSTIPEFWEAGVDKVTFVKNYA